MIIPATPIPIHSLRETHQEVNLQWSRFIKVCKVSPQVSTILEDQKASRDSWRKGKAGPREIDMYIHERTIYLEHVPNSNLFSSSPLLQMLSNVCSLILPQKISKLVDLTWSLHSTQVNLGIISCRRNTHRLNMIHVSGDRHELYRHLASRWQWQLQGVAYSWPSLVALRSEPERGDSCFWWEWAWRSNTWGFPEMGDPLKNDGLWGKIPTKHGWFRGTPILGNPQIITNTSLLKVQGQSQGAWTSYGVIVLRPHWLRQRWLPGCALVLHWQQVQEMWEDIFGLSLACLKWIEIEYTRNAMHIS